MNQLQAMRVFTRVVDLASFNLAARQLGMSAAAVTRSIGMLEAHLNMRLLNRTTRSLSLTEAGREYLDGCRAIIDKLDEIESNLVQATRDPRGTLRIASSMSFAASGLGPLLAAYRILHPRVAFDVTTFDTHVDMVEGAYDVCFSDDRHLASSTLVSRALTTIREVTVASPAYLARHGTPHNPAELGEHSLLAISDGTARSWEFADASGAYRVYAGSVLVSENSAMVRIAALNHMGIAQLPLPLVAADLDARMLVPLLQRRKTAAPLQRADLRDAQHRAKTREQAVRFGSRALDEARQCDVVERVRTLRRVREQRMHVRERRAQIVRDAVAYALHPVHQTFDLLEHVIDEVRQHVDLVAPADGQALPEIALRDALRDVADRLEPAHLPHAQSESARDAGHEAQNAAADQCVDDRLANAQDVREVACEHELVAVRAHLGHRAHDGRNLIACDLQRVVERRAGAIRRQLGRKREHVARDVRAVRGEEAVIVRVHSLVFEPAMNRAGDVAVRHRIEVDHLPVDHDIGLAFHVVRDRRRDEAEQHHYRNRERRRIDGEQTERRRIPPTSRRGGRMA